MDITSLEQAVGPNISLRLIQPEDASYVHHLRTSSKYNTHLSQVTGTVNQQKKWIEGYKKKESVGREFYYVIERKDKIPCGVIRLYDISLDRYTWGSWILDENKPRKAALESALLSFGIGFDVLKLDVAKIDVRLENSHAEAFYRRFGMVETHRTDRDIFFVYSRSQFQADKYAYYDILSEDE
ncbi:GNAT family N-acetyltransferase [Pontixanthobacter sp.]|uniref:GNAT family N-acetyltransferase n=1 Tax=Pontixanthobacter sp. TaxID=2792078 RepID=UPI003C7B2B4A